MKKNNYFEKETRLKEYLKGGIINSILGIILIIIPLFVKFKYSSSLFGAGCAIIVSGIRSFYSYRKWSNEENQGKFEEKLEIEEINLKDERKEKNRNISGRYAYIIGLVIILASIVTFTILDILNIIEFNKMFMIYLGIYLLFQYIIGVVIFNILEKNS